MRKRLIRTLRVIVLATLIVGVCRADKDSSAKREALFNATAYVGHIRYLASDELAGRLPGTEGGCAAAEYIAEWFKELGLKPAGVDGTYFQPFSIQRLKKLNEERAEFKIVGADRSWKIREDWTPFPFSKPGTIEGPLAFAGYGIEAPAEGYNDYAEFDATGKVLLIFRHEPKSDDPEADFGGKTPSRHALFSRKARVASKKGAKALLIVNAPNRDPEKDELYPWRDRDARQSYALPMVHISRELASVILKRAGMPDLKTLQEKLDSERQPLSSDLENVTVQAETGIDQVEGRNVLGLLEGDGRSEEIIIVGAHHDHLGATADTGEDGDEKLVVYNGADDNASGTSGVLEMARVFAAGPPPRRNILFMTFDAEEQGLLGSKHFVEHPTVSLDKVRAMVNLDMIGRLRRNELTIFGVPSGKELRDIVQRAAEAAGLEYAAPGTNAGFFGASDHFSFYRQGIPVLFAFTGVHKQYHQPEDDWELIDGDGAAKLLGMMYTVTSELANMETGPAFVSEEEQEKEAATQPAEEKPEDVERERPPRGGLTVRLGIMPDPADDAGTGLRIDTVIDNGPAAKGGMKDGDVIVRIADDPVTDIRSYMAVLRKYKPDDEVDVVVKRGDQQVTLKIKLEVSRRHAQPKDG
jgi:hypothetical protein